MSKQKVAMIQSLYYRSYSTYLSELFGEKVYRLCLDAGLSCPNRDGKLGIRGCVFCSDTGSWGGSGQKEPLEDQVRREKERVRKRYGAHRFIAYFQAFSNTYAPVDVLKGIYDSVLLHDDEIVGLAVGTRPDCVDPSKLALIASYQHEKAVWIEYGLQSAHDRTLELIGRGHDVQAFTDAVLRASEHGIGVFAHVIIGLPGEGQRENIETAEYLAGLPIEGVKIHNLNIIRGTMLATWLAEGRVHPLALDEYAERVVDFIERTKPDVAIARLNADTAPDQLIEPKWSLDKNAVRARIIDVFARRDSYQGRLYRS
jgi:radical SAM protein (TIGR01212 family)